MNTFGKIICVTAFMVGSPAVGAELCHVVVATDAPNPEAIAIHENAHCWGWVHPEHVGTRSKGYKAFMPPAKFKKPYPNIEVQFWTMNDVRKVCGKDEPFGCQWFD